jgi:hypothetical protein
LFDIEAALADERRNVTCHVAAFECPTKKRFQSLLPASHPSIRRQTVLEEDELAARLEDPSHAVSTLAFARGMGSAGRSRKLGIQLRSAPLLFCAPKHPRVGFERIDPVYSCEIVMNEVHAGTDANLKDIPLRQRNDALPNFPTLLVFVKLLILSTLRLLGAAGFEPTTSSV